jgi:hypothetical protein
MLRSAILASALLCALSVNAEARQRHRVMPACIETGTNLQPSCMGNDFLAGVKIRVTLKRVRSVPKVSIKHLDRHSGGQASFGSIARPIRYIAGRLICAINVNAALAERGIKGTGSALAHSFDHWGVRIAQPVPGAVAVTDRRGGGHVAYVARVDPDGRVFAWNPSPRGRGWELVEYTHRHARYRVAGI